MARLDMDIDNSEGVQHNGTTSNGYLYNDYGHESQHPAHEVPFETEPIAIIGMAHRFPGDVDDTNELWDFIHEGRCAASEVPKDKFNINSYYHPDHDYLGTIHAREGFFLVEDSHAFDAPFFSLTKDEAIAMDPQQKLVMESVFHALENAGISSNSIVSSSTSVFVGSFANDHLIEANQDLEALMKYKGVGTSHAMMANRVSWFFDLKGTSLAIDTACSSSLVALHLACQNLKSAESGMAIVSGVNVIGFPASSLVLGSLSFLSPDSRCYSYDHRGNGYARAEGVGTVIIKPLSSAIRDGDTIRAIIRGTGSNQDAKTPGITMPSRAAQEQMIRGVYYKAGLDPGQTTYVEGHGTGTPVGDPIEAGAISSAFESTSRKAPLYLGSIKSNMGHMEGAAGVAGVIKTVLALEAGVIPPLAGFEKPNPKIKTVEWNLRLPAKPVPWPSTGIRRASVNSFGFGGTNAHAILDDAYSYLASRGLNGNHNTKITSLQKLSNGQGHANGTSNGHSYSNGVSNGYSHANGLSNGHSYANGSSINLNGQNGSTEPDDNSRPHLLVFSAFDKEGIRRNADKLKQHLSVISETYDDQQKRQYLSDLAYTLSEKRSALPWKSFCRADSIENLIFNLGSGLSEPMRNSRGVGIGFVFNGQGGQWARMGQELMTYPVFRRSVQEASVYIRSLGSPWELIDEMQKDKANSSINIPLVSQSACTALQVAQVELLASWGIAPSSVVGHSSGEIAAAFAAGAISRQAAWKLAYLRGLVVTKYLRKRGAMMAVGATADAVQPYLDQVNAKLEGELVIACYNSPRNLTISGEHEKIALLKTLLDRDQVFARQLPVDTAYHSAHIRTVSDAYLGLMGDLSDDGEKLLPSQTVEMFSSVTAKVARPSDLEDNQYWVENSVCPVRFSEALLAMCSTRPKAAQQTSSMGSKSEDLPIGFILEIGPHSTMRSAIKETLAQRPGIGTIEYSHALSRIEQSANTIITSAGMLYCRGHEVNVSTVNLSAVSGKEKAPQMLTRLPPYAFNHAQTYRVESRITKNVRLRKHPRHDLFGAPVADWNAAEPRWRNILRISEIPWVEDHKISGNAVYPGVGYLVMAIEALKQTADPSLTITGIRLKDVSLKALLVIPDTKDGVESIISMRKVTESSLETSRYWNEFHISSYNPSDDSWLEHCSGMIQLEYDLATGPVDNGREAASEKQAFGRLLERSHEACRLPIDAKRPYEFIEKSGFAFGPSFRNMSHVKVGSGLGEAVGVVTIPNIRDIMPKHFLHPHTIHPATMDSLLHVFFAAVMDTSPDMKLDGAIVPTFIKEVWVSAEIDNVPKHTFKVHSKAAKISLNKYSIDITAWDDEVNEGRVTIKGLETSPIQVGSSEADNAVQKLCHNIEWVPDLQLANNTSTFLAASAESLEATTPKPFTQLQLASLLFITEALEDLKDFDVNNMLDYHRKFLVWMKNRAESLKSGSIRLQTQCWEQYSRDKTLRDQLLNEIKGSNDGELLIRMGSQIASILRQEVHPLEVMFRGDLMDRYYANFLSEAGSITTQLRSYLKLLGQNRTGLRIIEVGGGTGSMTSHFLETLNPMNADSELEGSRIASYTFTDISAGFFEKAKARFKDWESIMTFGTLNAENDPASQGYESGTYDIVVASSVLHATVDLTNTLSNIRSLLKPGGKLVVFETVQQHLLWEPLCFGLLPGWWFSTEPFRQWGPTASENEWNKLLNANGFSGTGIVLKDREDDDTHEHSLFISTAVSPSGTGDLAAEDFDHVLIICGSPAQMEEDIVAQLETKFLCKGVKTFEVVDYHDLGGIDLRNTLCVSLLGLDGANLSLAGEHEFLSIKYLLSTCRKMLWLLGDTTEEPHLAMVTGLIRVIRWERQSDVPNFVTLEFEGARPNSKLMVHKTIELCDKLFHGEHNMASNGEYLLRDDKFWSNRLFSATNASHYIHSKTRVSAPITQALGSNPNRALKLSSSAPGLLNKLQFIDDTLRVKPLGESEVEVEIKATSLNFRDVMIAMGQIPSQRYGVEGAGVVSRVGSKAKNVKIGDRVVTASTDDEFGTFQTFSRFADAVVWKIPDGMDFEDVVSIPIIFLTTMYSLHDLGRLSEGESILIHGAAGGTGQAAIQLAKLIGAEIFVTVSTNEKKDLLVKEYGIADDHIFSSRDLSFAKGIMRMTGNQGVDVVLNSLSGEALRRTWDCVAPFGRFVELGLRDGLSNGRLEMAQFSRNITYAGLDLSVMLKKHPVKIAQMMKKVLQMFSEKRLHTVRPLTVLDYSELEKGFRLLQSGKGMGKVVFKPGKEDLVPIVPEVLSPYRFPEDSSYVLAGGLGGLGRDLARWMASRGAKSFIFLSRSEATSGAAKELIEELQQQSCRAMVCVCDVSVESEVARVFEDCKASMPPIKGCIQCSMVLQDAMFENMTYQKYQAAVLPKVQGSWNLHNHLPTDLDFFIMLSSITGITGNRGQSNYAAGNVYQDALAKHRSSKGLAATSVNLGPMASVGYVAENEMLKSQVVAPPAYHLVTVEQLHSILEYHIDPRTTKDSLTSFQTVVGLMGSATMAQKGIQPPPWLDYPLYTHLNETQDSFTTDQSSDSDSVYPVRKLLSSAANISVAADVVAQGIQHKLSSMLSIPAEEIDTGKPLHSYGVDSLVAMEIRDWMAKVMAASVSTVDIIGQQSIADLSLKVAGLSTLVKDAGKAQEPANEEK